MIFQITIKFEASTLDDFDEKIIWETKLIELLGDRHEVDGHDFGEGEMNIYVHSEAPKQAFELIKSSSLWNPEASCIEVTYRSINSEISKLLWRKPYG